ncbi:MAG: hypothetical protein K0Q72_4397 [Armatimonadetes bacterium]|jgi:hypothetical protein|nr:hypothetical protein [Armatimonadota bacterium]
MSEPIPQEERGQRWAPASMEEDDRLEPDAPPSGVRRNQQDTQPVNGEDVLNLPDDELIQQQVVQG